MQVLHAELGAATVCSTVSRTTTVNLIGILVITVTEIDGIAKIFHFNSISELDFIILFTLSSSILWAGELYKYTSRKILSMS